MITVGLPVYNSKKIAWLAMESLCNQKVNTFWELIICEEQHPEMLGIEFYSSYRKRLKEAGCINVIYLKLPQWVNLIKKWQLIAEKSQEEVFIMQSADCYSPSNRLQLTHEAIKEGFDWVDFTKGYFYNFTNKRLILYNSHNRTNLSMGFKTEYLKKLPYSPQKSGVDGYLQINFQKMNPNLKIKTLTQTSNIYFLAQFTTNII